MAASTENKETLMEARAVARHVRVTPMKARRIVDLTLEVKALKVQLEELRPPPMRLNRKR